MRIREWSATRQLLLLCPVATVLGLTVAFAFPSSSVALAPLLLASGLNIISLFLYRSDAKRVADEGESAPRWWAWTAAALVFSSALVAPVYLAVHR